MSGKKDGMFQFTWNISRNDLLSLKNGQSVESSVIKADTLKKTKWFLTAFRDTVTDNGEFPSYTYRFNLNRFHSDCYERDINVSFKLEITDTTGINIALYGGHLISKRSHSRAGGLVLDDYFKCLNPHIECEMTDVLIVKCFLIDPRKATFESFQKLPAEEALNEGSSFLLVLQENLKDMLVSGKHSDVKLRSGDQILRAHKFWLSARSPVFSAMFDQDMIESQSGIVDISDVELEVLKSFLRFLYTDTISTTDYDEITKLMLVADKYQVNSLKKRCSKILMSKLSMENIYDVIVLADVVNQLDLKKSAISFIRTNKKEISSPVWKAWVEKYAKLKNEVDSRFNVGSVNPLSLQ